MLSDWNHFLRPAIWAYVIAIYIIAFLASGASFALVFFGIGILVFCMLCAASITVNHYFDIGTDRKSSQLHRFPVAAGRISAAAAAGISIGLMAIPVIIGFILPPVSMIFILLSVFMIVAYSARPLRIKERPFAETVWNGLGYGAVPFYLALSIFSMPATVELHLIGVMSFLIAASGHILLQVRDIHDDNLAQVTTTSTLLGRKHMIFLSKAMIFVSGIIIFYLAIISFLNLLAFGALAAGGLVFIEHRKMVDVQKSYRKLQVLYAIGGLFFIASFLKPF